MTVDLSKYLHFMRFQDGDGCWGYATCAIWDILNELHCPNSPAMSMNLWLMCHRRRDLWEMVGNNRKWQFYTPDGKFHSFMDGPEFGFFQDFGNTTEGTEPEAASGRWAGGFTEEGVNEAQNYRLKYFPSESGSIPICPIDISSKKFCEELGKNHPIRMEAKPPNFAGHVIAIVGFDDILKTFKYVDSAGNTAIQGGFGTLTFAEIDNKTIWGNYHIDKAYTIEVVPPRPVPVARIRIKHSNSRQNINLWVSAEGSPQPKRKIWPSFEWPNDLIKNLNFNVRLPSEFIWPPSPKNRVILDLYDSGAISDGGGEVVGLSAAFGEHIVNSNQVVPVGFKAGEHLRLYIP